jgi:violaxanthin de-epoxidase
MRRPCAVAAIATVIAVADAFVHHAPLSRLQQPQSAVRQTTMRAHNNNQPSWVQLPDIKSAVSSGVAALAIAASLLGSSTPTFAADAATNKAIGVCVLSNCKKELGACLLNPKCLANLICIQTCSGKPDETVCQIKCGDLFENEVVGKFNACAVSQKKCVPQKQDDGSYPVPPAEAQVKQFDTKIFTGQWYISAGLNPIFDIFDCQVHFFVNPAPGQVYAKLNWRIKEPDGEFFNRDTVQQFVQDKQNPALLLNHGNEYLHYQDDWYILDAEPNSHVLVYYRGQNDAWVGYGGAVLYTKDKTYSDALVPRLEAACARAGIKWSDFQRTDNSCKAASREDKAMLREQYAKKLLILGENQLAEQLTAVRGYATDSIKVCVYHIAVTSSMLVSLHVDVCHRL